jgi:hypothetical protein
MNERYVGKFDEEIITASICPYCLEKPELVDSKTIYGKSYGMMHLCRPCNAYVGCYKGSDVPLGRLADKDLREAKMAAHKAFDPVWKDGGMSRREAYQWLASQLDIPEEFCHIGMFDKEICEDVAEKLFDMRRNDPLTEVGEIVAAECCGKMTYQGETREYWAWFDINIDGLSLLKLREHLVRVEKYDNDRPEGAIWIVAFINNKSWN